MSVFIQTIKEIRQGGVLSDLDEQLQTLVGAVRATDRGGKLTLTVEIKPVKNAADNTLQVSASAKLTQPQAGATSAVLYADDKNNLSRKDPRQPELTGLREVGKVAVRPPAAATEGSAQS